jgi:undecaprenyl pyrophosphate phosphatase UppP
VHPDSPGRSGAQSRVMRILVWVLVGIGAVVLLGGVVLPLVSWLLGALVWLVPAALVVGGGVWLAKRAKERKSVGAPTDAPRLP